jgi:UDP-3-O-[3-hydroxymyristoyl] glucosamine N-acyltransferase
MADPRFFDNRGPFALAELCARASLACPEGAAGNAQVFDVAGLVSAGPPHLSFCDSARARADFLATRAGWCLVGKNTPRNAAPSATILIPSAVVGSAFAAVARLFYPEHELDIRSQEFAIHPSARLGEAVTLAPGVVIGRDAEVGDHTRIGANTVVGRGVTIGRSCEIGPNVSIGFAHLGDEIILQPGVAIGGSGFGFVSGPDGHAKTPQLGRVIVQDRVEIGANSAIDRGALADTVIGEGTKIDNLVQIGHNSVMGRHCIVAGQGGLSGSVVLGDFVIIGGGSGVADHVRIGDGARLAGLSGIAYDLEGGRDYGGIPARPIRDWHREMLTLAKLAKRSKRKDDE